MKALILYASSTPVSDLSQAIQTPHGTLWVRVEKAENHNAEGEPIELDLCDALDMAEPLPGEVVLNSIDFEDMGAEGPWPAGGDV